jgi:hypothetical protein
MGEDRARGGESAVKGSALKSVADVVEPRSEGLPSGELQQLWFATIRREWASLVIIPADANASSAPIAQALAEVAQLHRGDSVRLFSARGAQLGASARLIMDMTTHTTSGGLAIVALDPVVTNQAGIPLALSADAALLVVQMGASTLDAARRTIELVGKDRFVGCVTTRAR